MSRFPEYVYIRDMTTRDGFQMEHSFVPTEEKIKVITLPELITIKDLADKMKIPSSQIVK